MQGQRLSLTGEGNGPIDAAIQALRLPLEFHSYEERALGLGADAKAAATVELALAGISVSTYGVGIDANIITASIRAIFSGVNRLMQRIPSQEAAELVDAMRAPLRAVA